MALIQAVTNAASSIWDTPAGKILAVGLSVPAVTIVFKKLKLAFGEKEDQNIRCFIQVLWDYRNVDFKDFMKSHHECLAKAKKTGDFVDGVCNYYKLMSSFITTTSGPFWHFVPMTKGKTRKQCHEQFHHTMAKYLQAKTGDKILEIGCGYGEIGRQVALISGASVTGLTMAPEEVAGGTERIQKAGLEGRCRMVQGNYHKLPFEKDTFDKVFGVYTLKYSAQLQTALSEAARVLKPGGRVTSYEILLTDKFDTSNARHRYYADNISDSTCMPPLHTAHFMRDCAKKAGLVLVEQVDLDKLPGEGPWYQCFTQTGIFSLLMFPGTYPLIRFAEALHILPKGFAEFYDYCCVHPTTDFVQAGRLDIISGAIMMVWEKPKA